MKSSSLVYIVALPLVVLTSCTEGIERRLGKQLDELRSIQAEQTSSISELKNDVRELTGRLDEVQHSSQGRTKELERSIEKLGSLVPPPTGVPLDLFTQDEERISKINGGQAENYKKALQLLRSGEFDQSRSVFQNFARENPGTAFTDNALFWGGICSMKLGQPDQAVVSFSEAYQKYPAEDMVSPSLYYMAEALFALGSGNDGVLTLQKLVDEHPTSEYAIKAKEKLKVSKKSR